MRAQTRTMRKQQDDDKDMNIIIFRTQIRTRIRTRVLTKTQTGQRTRPSTQTETYEKASMARLK